MTTKLTRDDRPADLAADLPLDCSCPRCGTGQLFEFDGEVLCDNCTTFDLAGEPDPTPTIVLPRKAA